MTTISDSGRPNVSLCIPSTVISNKNGYNLQQITSIVYQIARAATIYKIGEIVVLNVPEDAESGAPGEVVVGGKKMFTDDIEDENTVSSEEPSGDIDDGFLLASLLQFFITPPYLVKQVFSEDNCPKPQIIKKFKYAAKLPKITTLPFMNEHKYKLYKEGITIAKATPKIMKKNKQVKASKKLTVTKYVNIGEKDAVMLNIKREVPINSRVTVDIKNKTIVSPQEAYGQSGAKSGFGYLVRLSTSFLSIFTESAVEGGYTSTVFVNCDDTFNKNDKIEDLNALAPYKSTSGNILVVLGNYKHYERSFKRDTSLQSLLSMSQMFDHKLEIGNTIRVEDSILIALTKILG